MVQGSGVEAAMPYFAMASAARPAGTTPSRPSAVSAATTTWWRSTSKKRRSSSRVSERP